MRMYLRVCTCADLHTHACVGVWVRACVCVRPTLHASESAVQNYLKHKSAFSKSSTSRRNTTGQT